MKITYLIHPLNHLIIRRNSLVGFEDEICLDKLDKNTLQFKRTKEKTTDKKSIHSFKDDVVGMRGVPEGGWVQIDTQHDEKIDVVWSEAVNKLKHGETI